MSERKVVRIGTRESKLAMWQAEMVKSVMSEAHPEVDFVVVGMTTMGDKDQMKPLSSFDSKGVFTKELDHALEKNLIDVAVHCMKDLATLLPFDQQFFATVDRGIVEDVVILHPKYHEEFQAKIANNHEYKKSVSLDMLPEGAVIGTSALRRQATVSRFHPHLAYKDIRGNVFTRISKLDDGLYDAIILARIGLERLEIGHRANDILDVDMYQHAVGQGALAIVGRPGDQDIKDLFSTMDHAVSALQCAMERGMLSSLQGGCKVPIAVSSKVYTTKRHIADAYLADLTKVNQDVIEANKNQTDVGLKVAPTFPEQPELTLANREDAVAILVTRGTVMSLDGKKVIESQVGCIFDAHPVNNETTFAEAWKAGQQLGQYLRELGAEIILGEIRG